MLWGFEFFQEMVQRSEGKQGEKISLSGLIILLSAISIAEKFMEWKEIFLA